jgi:hypothetical protein
MASAATEPDTMPGASSAKPTSTSKGRFRGGSKQGSFNKEPTPPPEILNGTVEALEKMKINYKLEDFEIKSTLGEFNQTLQCTCITCS